MAEMTLKAIEIDLAGRACQSAGELAATDAGVKHFAARQPERVAKIAAMFRLPEGTK